VEPPGARTSVGDRGWATRLDTSDQLSNLPLNPSYAVQAKRRGTDQATVGTRDPFRRKK